MDLVLGIVFSYFYSVFYYIIPINLVPIVILYSIRKYNFLLVLLFSFIFGIISDLIYPNKIWISPIFYIALCYIISFLKEDIIILIILFIFWLLCFEFFKFMLDFKTNYIILFLRIFITTIVFSVSLQYLKSA